MCFTRASSAKACSSPDLASACPWDPGHPVPAATAALVPAVQCSGSPGLLQAALALPFSSSSYWASLPTPPSLGSYPECWVPVSDPQVLHILATQSPQLLSQGKGNGCCSPLLGLMKTSTSHHCCIPLRLSCPRNGTYPWCCPFLHMLWALRTQRKGSHCYCSVTFVASASYQIMQKYSKSFYNSRKRILKSFKSVLHDYTGHQHYLF